jgi:hypothetical protein
MAVLCHEHKLSSMKMNQYQGDGEFLSVPYSTNETVDGTDQGPELERESDNRVFGVGNSPSSDVAASIARRGPFPRRTLIVCFTIWLIATQAMIFDQLKFNERADLLEREAGSLGGPRVVIPNEWSSNLPSGEKVQRL